MSNDLFDHAMHERAEKRSAASLAIFFWRQVGNQSLAIGFLLQHARQMAGIHDEAVDHYIPSHEIIFHAAGQCPARFHHSNLEKSSLLYDGWNAFQAQGFGGAQAEKSVGQNVTIGGAAHLNGRRDSHSSGAFNGFFQFGRVKAQGLHGTR
jgi:hypothetical protein